MYIRNLKIQRFINSIEYSRAKTLYIVYRASISAKNLLVLLLAEHY